MGTVVLAEYLHHEIACAVDHLRKLSEARRHIHHTEQLPQVINGASDLIVEVFGKDIGAHTRSAVGMAELPFGVPVEIEAEVAIR